MARVELLDPKVHGELRYDARRAARENRDRFVQIAPIEFPLVAVRYPIFLSKDAETGGFYFGAMLGIDPDENLYAGDDAIAAPYRPLQLQRLPFFLAAEGLAADLENPYLSETGPGETLFDFTGEYSDYLQTVRTALVALHNGMDSGRALARTLLEHDLVESVEIELSFDDGSTRTLEGLYSVSRDSLSALPDTVVTSLFRSGDLERIHLLLASLKCVPMVAARKNARLG
ncbi:SapC family protein [Sphingomonas morindae]|uniref:SapC family protein n=1 Tax=Sphingomonas morindae TaxID=1541170 RepID=A0ABY4XDI1_9SPHN|nr:SapC family protein [Sphingomonas morindae]USI74750.1 SapC family protein [Sphingomonas morindae]